MTTRATASRSLVGAALVSLLLASASAANAQAGPSPVPPPPPFSAPVPPPPPFSVPVSTDKGQVQGYPGIEPGVVAFLGIPFGAAPVGELRWKAPQPVAPWQGVRDGKHFKPACIQASGLPRYKNAAVDLAESPPASEDCLYLNVWTGAAAPGEKRPVMLWLYGGAYTDGGGNSPYQRGDHLAANGAVVVSMNYRLGGLGFLVHPDLAKESGHNASGNYALADAIAAMTWIKANIAQFGGDPSNVTLAGESAGGLSTMAVLAVPSARGLYHRAIVQSGGGWYPVQSVAVKEEQGVKLLAPTGATAQSTLAELRAIPVDRLAGLAGDYGPYPDGVLMPETPTQAIAHGRFPDVPLMIGWNSGEDTLMGPSPLPAATLAQIPPIARMVYPKEAAEGDEALARVIFTDSLFGASARWVAAQTASGQPSFLYHFSYIPEALRGKRTSAGHATEIPYVWKTWGRPVGDIIAPDAPLAELMHACWVGFIKTGAPACGSTPWPAYAASADQLMEFTTDSGVRTGFKKSAFTAQELVWLPQLGLK